MSQPKRHWRLTAEQKELVESHYRLAFWVVKKYCKPACEIMGEEEVFSWALEALCNSAHAFKPTLGFSFRTYATRSIRMIVFRNLRQQRSVVRAPEYAHRSGSKYYELAQKTIKAVRFSEVNPDNMPDPVAPESTDLYDQREIEQKLVALVCRLDKRSQQVLRRRFWDNKTLQEIGEEMHLSRERIRQLSDCALDRLRLMWDDPDIVDDIAECCCLSQTASFPALGALTCHASSDTSRN